ncbi:MAG: DNA starvation/stationary phase protection protein [Cytophagales bacterium]|nr:DNA starvation/stationary phase protection protein [Cytophagales bacterium]
MEKLNHIGLDKEVSEKLAKHLNDLLANYSVFYQNVRGFHWNIQGDKFFELHQKFEELYNDLFNKIDEVAERVLTLGEVPNHKFTDYQSISEIEESDETSDGLSAVGQILNSFKILLAKQRVVLDLSGEINDEGTNSLMSDYIREQEKLVWMYSAFLR